LASESAIKICGVYTSFFSLIRFQFCLADQWFANAKLFQSLPIIYPKQAAR